MPPLFPKLLAFLASLEFPRPLLLACAVLLAAPSPARAETVTLRSGRQLQASAVRVLDRALSITLRVDGGKARVDLRFERLDPEELVRLLDRHAPTDDGTARLRTARLALEFGLREEAVRRFREAAELDAALAGERDRGLAVVRGLEAADALGELETRLRDGRDPQGALVLASALLDGPRRDALTPAQTLRVGALARLARAVLQRMQASPPAPAATVPLAAPPDTPGAAHADAATGERLARVRALADKALHARERAANPALGAPQVTRHLEIAARALLDARRALRELPEALRVEATPGEAAVRALLAATYLDLAAIHRQAGHIDRARAHVRATLILDPGNEAAWSLRLAIEEDVRRELLDPFDPYGPALYDALVWPGAYAPFPGAFRSAARTVALRYPGARAIGLGYGPVRFPSGHRHGATAYGHRGAGHVHRVVGTRRSR